MVRCGGGGGQEQSELRGRSYPSRSGPIAIGRKSLEHTRTPSACGELLILGGGQMPVNLSAPTQVCRETNWVGLGTDFMGFYPLVQTRSGELWEPFHGAPDAEASVSSTCRLLFSDSTPERVAMA